MGNLLAIFDSVLKASLTQHYTRQFFKRAWPLYKYRHFLWFARRLNVKIKVNGIRVNKTTGCLGNSVPCPTHSSLAFTFLQSLESYNTLLTEGHNNRQAVQHFQIVFEQDGLGIRGDTQGWWLRESALYRPTSARLKERLAEARGLKRLPHSHYHNHQSANRPGPPLKYSAFWQKADWNN